MHKKLGKKVLDFKTLEINESEYYYRACSLVDLFNDGFSKFYNIKASVIQIDNPPYSRIVLEELTTKYKFFPNTSQDFSLWLFDLPNFNHIKNNGIIFNIYLNCVYHVDYEYSQKVLPKLSKKNSYPDVKYIKYLNKKEIFLGVLTFITSILSGVSIEFFANVNFWYRLRDLLHLSSN